MKEMNKIFYDILLKIQIDEKNVVKINQKVIIQYFPNLKSEKTQEYMDFESYFQKLYQFCFELSLDSMIRDAINFN